MSNSELLDEVQDILNTDTDAFNPKIIFQKKQKFKKKTLRIKKPKKKHHLKKIKQRKRH